MFILEVLLYLKSEKDEVTAEFLHADIFKDEKVYVEMPIGFEQFSKNGREKMLKLKKTLHGICQIPRAFWQYLMKALEQSGLN